MSHNSFPPITHSLRRFAVLGLTLVFMNACSLFGFGETDEEDDSLIIGTLAALGASSLFRTTPTAIVLYGTGPTAGTAIGARSGADAICTVNVPSGFVCSNIRALISVDSGDSVSNMPFVWSVPLDRQLQSVNGTVIANTWTDALDNRVSASLDTAGVFTTAATYYWTGTAGNGAVSALSTGTCAGWTSSGSTGSRGRSDQADSDWLGFDFNNSNTHTCSDTTARMVCLCWN